MSCTNRDLYIRALVVWPGDDGGEHELRKPRVSFFFKNPKLLGVGRQIGLKFFEAFEVFLAKLSALFWHCESLVHGKMYLDSFPTKNFGFQV